MRLGSRARMVVLAGVLAGALPGVGFAQTEQDAYYQFLLARHLESEGDYQGALEALRRAAAADPEAADIQAEIALVLYRDGQRSEAEKAAKAALALDANNIEANRVLGSLYTDQAQNEQATAAQRLESMRNAITHLERVAAQTTSDPILTRMLGGLYLSSGQVDKAIASLSEAVEQNPFAFEPRRVLALAYSYAKDYPAAVAVLQEIVDEEPRALGLIAGYQYEGGMYAEAAETYERALAVQPRSREYKERRVRALYFSGEYAEAASAASAARRQHPEEPLFAGLEAESLLQAGEHERAASVAAEAQRQFPDNPWFPRLQAQGLAELGNHGRAIDLLESAARTFPKDTGLQYDLADLYHDAGRRDDAEKVLRQILTINPSHPDALNYLGYLLALNGENLDEAIQLVSRALEARPDNGAYLDSLGWAYFRRGDLNEAEKYLGAAVDRMPGNSEVLDHMGDLHAARGRWQEAIDAWSAAIAGEGDGIDPAVVKKKIEDARAKLAR